MTDPFTICTLGREFSQAVSTAEDEAGGGGNVGMATFIDAVVEMEELKRQRDEWKARAEKAEALAAREVEFPSGQPRRDRESPSKCLNYTIRRKRSGFDVFHVDGPRLNVLAREIATWPLAVALCNAHAREQSKGGA